MLSRCPEYQSESRQHYGRFYIIFPHCTDIIFSFLIYGYFSSYAQSTPSRALLIYDNVVKQSEEYGRAVSTERLNQLDSL